MKNLTDITIVLDRSGSMSNVVKDTVGGYNTFIKEQVENPNPCVISLYQFDHLYETVYEGAAPSAIPLLKFHPRGSTALLDAVALTINNVGRRLAALPESERPDKVLFVIMTDGGENSSREFKDVNKVREMIEHQRTKYNWEFLFLGADFDVIDIGANMGFASHQTANISKSGMMEAWTQLSSARNTYSCTGKMDYDNA